jgi:hypothetical protein
MLTHAMLPFPVNPDRHAQLGELSPISTQSALTAHGSHCPAASGSENNTTASHIFTVVGHAHII